MTRCRDNMVWSWHDVWVLAHVSVARHQASTLSFSGDKDPTAR